MLHEWSGKNATNEARSAFRQTKDRSSCSEKRVPLSSREVF